MHCSKDVNRAQREEKDTLRHELIGEAATVQSVSFIPALRCLWHCLSVPNPTRGLLGYLEVDEMEMLCVYFRSFLKSREKRSAELWSCTSVQVSIKNWRCQVFRSHLTIYTLMSHDSLTCPVDRYTSPWNKFDIHCEKSPLKIFRKGGWLK